jgi:hypothetical protein
MMGRRRKGELAQHVADRRRREDEAPRLQAEVPQLARLSLAVGERPAGVLDPGAGHIRRVVVDSAAALFLVPCTAGGCQGGAHDLTSVVMRELRRGATHFEGDTSCDGCACVLTHVGTAEYRG